MFSCCGFLSFSLVFCRLGGRLETTLYIHFTRRWVGEAPFFGASRRRRREITGKNAILRSWRLCGAYVEFINRPVQLTTSASHTYWTSPFWRRAYTASLTAARHQVSVPGVGGTTTPFTTSTAPISANSSDLRRVRSRVRRKSPTLLCLHR